MLTRAIYIVFLYCMISINEVYDRNRGERMDIKIYAFADEASAGLDGQIAAMKENGLDGLEIRNTGGVNVSKLTSLGAREIRKRLDDAGLRVWSAGSPLGKTNITDKDFVAQLDSFKHTLDIADILGAECIRLFSFYIPEGENPDKYRNEVIERLGKFAESAKESGITLCHENEKGIYGDTAARCLEIHIALPQIKGVFDPANFVQCGQDTLEAWERLKPYIKYMHIKDALTDGRVVPAGRGNGNIRRIVKDFIGSGGNVFTMEPHLAVFEGFAALERGATAKMHEGGKTYASEFVYESGRAAFDAACVEFKNILREVL